jgi:radical SAM superfamily enzyme YgiQ (UPF0313 family)
MCLVEIARGCPYRCTFCYTGHNLGPYRSVPAALVKEWIAERLGLTRRFGLVSSAVGFHPHIDEICTYCDEMDVQVSCSSLRAEDVTPTMIRSLARSGAQVLTVAPEAGSARLRRFLGKARLPDERIYEVIEMAVAAGIPNLKMYFLIGLPTETDDDVHAIAALVRHAREVLVKVSRPRGRIGTLAVNVGVFVPKPGTPLGCFAPVPASVTADHCALLTRQLQKVSNLRYQSPSLILAQVQAILSNGDLRAANLLLAAHQHGGDWKRALREFAEA